MAKNPVNGHTATVVTGLIVLAVGGGGIGLWNHEGRLAVTETIVKGFDERLRAEKETDQEILAALKTIEAKLP